MNTELEMMCKDATIALFNVPPWPSSGATEDKHEITQDSRFLGRYLNPEPSEDEAGVPTIGPLRSLCYDAFFSIGRFPCRHNLAF
jgi:hypothetical protein